jgi:hypothetical protein
VAFGETLAPSNSVEIITVVSRGVVKDHAATVALESLPGSGAQFTLRFQFAAEAGEFGPDRSAACCAVIFEAPRAHIA